MDIGIVVVIGLVICVIAAYVVGYRRGSRRFKRFTEYLGWNARGVFDERSDVQFPSGAVFLVEDADEYGNGDDPIPEALNPFDQQFITWQERFDYPPGTPDGDKAEYRYFLIAQEAWEDYELFSDVEGWASMYAHGPDLGEESPSGGEQ